MKNKMKLLKFKLFLIAAVLWSFCYVQAADEYPFVRRTSETLTYASAIDLKTVNTLTIAELTMGGSSATINLDSDSRPVIGDRVVFVITADTTTKDTINWGASFTAPQSFVDSIKTKLFEFIYDGSDFKIIGTPMHISFLYLKERTPDSWLSTYMASTKEILKPRSYYNIKRPEHWGGQRVKFG